MTVQQFAPQGYALTQAISWELAQGGRLVQTAPDQAWVARPVPPVNHVMHAILTLFTFGVWAIVWMIAVASRPSPPIAHLWYDHTTGQVYTRVRWK